MPTTITIPLLNPNEPEARITALLVSEGQLVSAGQPLCTLETTKSAFDMEAEVDGFVIGLQFRQGQIVHAGDTLCFLAEDPSWIPTEAQAVAGEIVGQKPGKSEVSGLPGSHLLPIGLRITQPALALAKQLGLDLGNLPTERLVTESLVRKLCQKSASVAFDSTPVTKSSLRSEVPLPVRFTSTSNDTRKAIIIYGAGGHGKTLIDLLRTLGNFRIVGLVDDGVEAGEEIMGLPVLGANEILPQLRAQGVEFAVNAVGGIGNLGIRIGVFQDLIKAGFVCPTVVHPSAVVEESAVLGEGVQIFAHAYVGSETRVGFGCIVNTGAIVSHDCLLGDYANISPGAMLAGEVHIGERVLVGMGVTINLQVEIGVGSKIGNGATIKENVPENGIVRAGSIWP